VCQPLVGQVVVVGGQPLQCDQGHTVTDASAIQQGQGIGQQLIRFGLDELRVRGEELVFTYGDPNYYSKVGFKAVPEKTAKAPFALSQPEGWLGQSLTTVAIEPLPGYARCVAAFNEPDLW